MLCLKVTTLEQHRRHVTITHDSTQTELISKQFGSWEMSKSETYSASILNYQGTDNWIGVISKRGRVPEPELFLCVGINLLHYS